MTSAAWKLGCKGLEPWAEPRTTEGVGEAKVLRGVSSAEEGLGAGSGAVERKGGEEQGWGEGRNRHNVSQSLVVAGSQTPLLPGR